MSLQTLRDVQNIEASACAGLLRFSVVSQGASPRFRCGFTQASYGPRRDPNLRVETSEASVRGCPSLLSVVNGCS